ncbi:hypothetical protein BU16DRAFT_151096 [Lophium mytilinum]|uniref:RNase MRP protein 1 RNA binding domain-containing protein n=1 Tax=Lophium mytilinum TaxID=390894 RepID=A0A6A6QFW0_9PEZI|nr:hypothetical protein BU16DRAFT_151096 [Lophium mytilinum]
MGPKPTPNHALSLTPTEKTELATTLELLTRLYVRNVNQHRRSHWFSSLVAFRKQLGLLLGEIEAATEGIKSLKGKKAQEAKEEGEMKVTERLGFWDEVCHGWYLTFTQLLAAGQFAVLGLVLMAAVARVCKLVGITEFYQDFASEDMKEVLQVMEKGEAVIERI